ncbi:MAG TPA: chromosome segregation protein SMC, partial [Candidatus Nanopelagicales bacterium]
MHLKSLTVKGFKSFASSTTLAFEPGVTCVVGPNGSGKSNVVDALAWVMGEQGAKSLRGGKMEDVIFAGTSGRAPLGRAEVSLTIDNSDGALPIDYAEVTITRTMFRSGGSEYAINGSSCRLLDIQELLSDSGIGREMHVIVGQGQLDQILHATPEDRRGFIEEAAGVLKHRKRKERAVRKLEAMQANLTRVQDLTTELRRQLTPLGKQAEVARRASVIQTDLRDASLRLLADDLQVLSSQYEQEIADESALRERRSLVEAELANAQAAEAVREAEALAQAPTLARAQETWFGLSSLRERLAGTVGMAEERVRSLAPEPEEERRGRAPDELEAEARTMRSQEADLNREVEEHRSALSLAVSARTAAEAAFATAEQELRAAVRAAADRREGLVRLQGQVHAAQSRAEARASEIQRLREQAQAARERAARAEHEFRALEASIAGLDEGEVDLDTGYEAAQRALAAVDARATELAAREAELERSRAGLAARVEALAPMVAVADAGWELAGGAVPGVAGTVAGALRVDPGYEVAIGAALGAAADAAIADGDGAAVTAIGWLADGERGRAGVVVPGLAVAPRSAWPALPAGALWAVDVVSADGPLADALAGLLDHVAVVDGDLAAALRLVRGVPGARAVTRAGELVGHGLVVGGSQDAPSRIEVAASLESAREQLASVVHETERLRFELAGVRQERAAAAAVADEALERLHDSDARMAAVAEQLGNLGQQSRSASAEAERIERSLAASEQALAADRTTLDELTVRLGRATADPIDDAEPSPDARDEAGRDAEVARRGEMEARLAVRTAEERARAIAGRAEQLERAAAAERQARRAAVERRERRARAAAVAQAVATGGAVVLARLELAVAAAAGERTEAEQARAATDAELAELRGRIRTLQADLEELTSSVHRDEVARAEQRLRIEALQGRAMAEFGMEPEALVAEYGPEQLVPPSLRAPGDEVDPQAPEPAPYPYVRAEQERRLRTAEKALALLGRVNPLALEEFAALEERHRFLTEQLDDLKRSRKDLLDLISDVDQRVEEVFTAAFADTAVQFEAVFARLFPGGEGRLVLTDPESMLSTGIEVEARPPGKKIKRLSLLSGGERSLTAVAFLVALFKARPSPFYVMDEVEAALDDVNLGRLLEVLEELRADSQLIVITHQKRTMEIADALYGVSMRGDGVTHVISQRL